MSGFTRHDLDLEKLARNWCQFIFRLFWAARVGAR